MGMGLLLLLTALISTVSGNPSGYLCVEAHFGHPSGHGNFHKWFNSECEFKVTQIHSDGDVHLLAHEKGIKFETGLLHDYQHCIPLSAGSLIKNSQFDDDYPLYFYADCGVDDALVVDSFSVKSCSNVLWILSGFGPLTTMAKELECQYVGVKKYGGDNMIGTCIDDLPETERFNKAKRIEKETGIKITQGKCFKMIKLSAWNDEKKWMRGCDSTKIASCTWAL